MAILKVARLGHPVLRKKASEVDLKKISDPFFQKFIDDMIETMREYNGIGLAAPQVHESIRVCVIELPTENPRYKIKEGANLQVFINPKVKILTKKTDENWEGCLSVPGMRGYVSRPNHIFVEYYDREGQKKELEAKGFLAVVIQHEFDHLDGILYVDKVHPKMLVFEDEFEKYILPSLKEDEVLD
jgi:peptide deformylase